MSTSQLTEHQPSFAVWLTGLPASGKTTIAKALQEALAKRQVDAVLLDSDQWRAILTPHATYSEGERDIFYEALAQIAALLANHGVPVIIAATANRKRYRDRARALINRFVEVLVDCPIETCAQRDPKGLYQRSADGHLATLPGSQITYERPEQPEMMIDSVHEKPQSAADKIIDHLSRLGYLPCCDP